MSGAKLESGSSSNSFLSRGRSLSPGRPLSSGKLSFSHKPLSPSRPFPLVKPSGRLPSAGRPVSPGRLLSFSRLSLYCRPLSPEWSLLPSGSSPDVEQSVLWLLNGLGGVFSCVGAGFKVTSRHMESISSKVSKELGTSWWTSSGLSKS